MVQGTSVGNLRIEKGKQIPPGGPDLNAEEQETWLEQNTDIQQVNTGEADPLWTMYPTGQEAAGSTNNEEIRHPGYRFDTDTETCDNPHSRELERSCDTR